MTPRQLAALVLLSAIWGASYLFIRIAAPVLGPFPLMAARVLLAAAALAAVSRWRGEPISFRGKTRQFLLLGLTHAALPFSLIAMAELRLSASMAAILTAAQPLFASLISTVWLGERLTPSRLAGLTLGMGGVGVLVGWSPIALTPAVMISILMAILASASYAVGSIYARRAFTDVSPMSLSLGQQLGALVWLLPPAIATAGEVRVTAPAIGALIALAICSTALAYRIFFWLLGQVGAVRAGTITYVIPVFGVLWGTLFLGETASAGVALGLGLILSSLVLVNGVRLRLPRLSNGGACDARA